MNILVIVASRRIPGNSFVLAREAAAGATKAGAAVETVHATEIDIAYCKGCLACVFKGGCPIRDDMVALAEKLLFADGLIVAAPIYLLSPSAVVKKMVDRSLMVSSRLDKTAARTRAALTITTAGKEDGNPLGMELLNQFALSYNFSVFDYIEAFAPGPAQVLLQEGMVELAWDSGFRLVKHLSGEIPAKQASSAQCPACYSRSFRLLGGSRVLCPFCLTEGEMAVSGRITFKAAEKSGFWAPAPRRHHLESWIKPSRDTFLRSREEIRERLKKYL